MPDDVRQDIKDAASSGGKMAAKGAAFITGPGLALVGAVVSLIGLAISALLKAVTTHVRKVAGNQKEFIAGSFFQAWEDFFSGMFKKSMEFPILPYKSTLAKIHNSLVSPHNAYLPKGEDFDVSGRAAGTMPLPEEGVHNESQIIGGSRNAGFKGPLLNPEDEVDVNGLPINKPRHANAQQFVPPVLVQGNQVDGA